MILQYFEDVHPHPKRRHGVQHHQVLGLIENRKRIILFCENMANADEHRAEGRQVEAWATYTPEDARLELAARTDLKGLEHWLAECYVASELTGGSILSLSKDREIYRRWAKQARSLAQLGSMAKITEQHHQQRLASGVSDGA